MSFTDREFRDALGQFATGVCVITAEVDGILLGSTVSSFNSVSLAPPLVLFSLARSSQTLALWLNALWLMAAWVVLQICVGIALQGSSFVTGGDGVQVAVAAHIGGFVVGVLLANPLLLFKYRKA